ncbi:hypothetical protein RB195_011410 [Necator americanus]|uniref:Endonuclease/exonuclease/phosphatase domain-containing protein n=1 Tax=Necator americanus TaxID=51031 RepID=A0ABR1D2B8_NECAM
MGRSSTVKPNPTLSTRPIKMWTCREDIKGITPRMLLISAKHSNRKESPDSGGKPGTVAPGRTGLQESCRLPKRKRTRMAICTYNARTLASEAAIEDLMMQAKKIKYDVIGLTETRRRHPLNAVYETGEELF